MDAVLRVLAFAAGGLVVLATVGSAVRTVVLPRGVPARMASTVFIAAREVFHLRLRRASTYEDRDRIMAPYAPLSLLLLALTWLVAVATGYVAMFWAVGVRPLREAFVASGSSLLTLGFARPPGLAGVALAFSEAVLGLTLVALLIAYLPTLYSSFSRREATVTRLEVRAGSPPWGVEMLERFARIGWLDHLRDEWDRWEVWFVELEETHTSFPSLVFFRSPQPDHSWVTAAGAVLDAASLASSCMLDHDPRSEVCLRAGYLALRRIADFFGIAYDPQPDPTDRISITRQEFDDAYARILAAGVPVLADRDQCWADFAGWRVNYDTVLLALCSLTMAPLAPWSSDRSSAFKRVKVFRQKGRA